MLSNLSSVSNIMEARKNLLPDVDQLIKTNVNWENSKNEYDKHKKGAMEALGKEGAEQLLNMEDAKSDMSSIELEAMYYKGIEDAIEILKGLKII